MGHHVSVFTLLSVETHSISRPLFQYSPLIDNENFAYVHHMLVYICAGLNETQVNDSAPCQGGVGESLSECLAGEVIGGWAVGGEVSNINALQKILNAVRHAVVLLCASRMKKMQHRENPSSEQI